MSNRVRTRKRLNKQSKIRTIIRTKLREKKPSNKSKEYKMNMSDKNYKKLLSKKRLTKSQKKNLDKALHVKYCNCVKSLKYKQNNPAAYGICANSVYKNRGIKMPSNAANKCKKNRK
tara:strand:- start:8212 stop:8562 length:351 start_codon:yes stop_codon:yes gene_type:complete